MWQYLWTLQLSISCTRWNTHKHDSEQWSSGLCIGQRDEGGGLAVTNKQVQSDREDAERVFAESVKVCYLILRNVLLGYCFNNQSIQSNTIDTSFLFCEYEPLSKNVTLAP